ncbi:MAG: leucine--tRNA ligase, partial [Candidatus Jacksonbacteria bacterium]|nr:leucine--tRNA ligase [Candidatus Jacksonbacteria bacterium]
MDKYNHFEIEKKWQERWAADNIWAVENKKSKDNAYVLDMFPYPSGAGLHVGHPKGYTATDVYSRYLRMNGKNVLHPIGWDAFGLPTENYAIKAGIPPAKATKDNVETFTKQIQSLGLSYDWSRQINTSTPEYYKWTQWMFLFLYKHGLAYKKKAPVNWCESCQTVLAREQVIDGRCERCKNDVVQKELKQWFFKITEYADRLLEGLEDIDWPTPIKAMQKNWIGKSKGALLKFEIRNSKSEIEVYTTRPDTLFGATYMVLAPEHSLVKELKDQIKNWEEVSSYVTSAGKKSELERTQLQKEKSGVELKGVSAINPGNGKEIPVWIADYVMASYGTGAIMAVPAHDERDFEFAQKFGLPIHYVIAPVFGKPHKDAEYRKTVTAIVQRKNDNKILMLKWKKFDWIAPPIGGIEDGESIEKTAE